MQVTLSAKNKLRFVDGSIVKPPEHDFAFDAWRSCNSMVMSLIMNDVVVEILGSLMYMTQHRKCGGICEKGFLDAMLLQYFA